MTRQQTVRFSLILFSASLLVSFSGCRKIADDDMQTVEANSANGSISIHKMGGDIDLAEAPNGANLATMGGSIHVSKAASFLKAHTMGGNIVIERASGPVDASTMGGKIDINDANGPIHASTMGGDIKARMTGESADARDIDLDSKAGTITLIVPKDFSMEVHIQLAHTRNADREFQIVDHIGLQQEESKDWEFGNGTPRKFIRAYGKVGDGKNHVTIKTINGDVILKQE